MKIKAFLFRPILYDLLPLAKSVTRKLLPCITNTGTLQLSCQFNSKIFNKLTENPPPPGATQPIVGVYFTALCRALASSRMRLLDHKQRRATVGRTPLNE